MLNRRTLRIKAFKGLFAYQNFSEVNYNLALSHIQEIFSPDLNSDEAYDIEALRAKEKNARAVFLKFFQQYREQQKIVAEGEIEEAALSGLNFYIDQNKRDLQSLVKELTRDIENIRSGQYSILQLLIDLAFQNKKLADEKLDYGPVVTKRPGLSIRLYENRIISKFKEHQEIIDRHTKKDVHLVTEADKLRDWYKGILKKDAVFKAYMEGDEDDYDSDWKIVDHLVRNIIFKNEIINNYFEEQDINWTENKAIIRSLTLRTLKSVQTEGDALKFAEISYNWEEDARFLVDLFKKSAERMVELEHLIRENLENWDINRIALTDKVILIIAICEMIEFPSIPIKVSINEYIDISKQYSTPKSKNFVNGMLDVISSTLFENGRIKKSGRGLIDNK